MSGYNIGEGFKEMFRTFKTGKGYERRKREERYDREQREFKRKKKQELESKRKALQSEIKRSQKNKESKKNYKIVKGGRYKEYKTYNKDGTVTIHNVPLTEEERKSYNKKEEKKQTKTISPKGGNIDDMSFAEAFKSSKSAGKKEFTWRGNKYHTRTKEEEAKKYEEGGVSAPKGYHWMKKGNGKYELMKHGDKPFKPHKGASSKAKFPIQKKHNTKYEEGGEIQRHQSPGFQTMFEIGSKMNLFGGGPASEKAKMRHERKMARQGARADRKMVRTEGRQERRADRLAGRQEAGSRRQDRRDARQESRLGYYQKGGKTPRIKKKDRPTGAELDELLYKQQYGVDYADDPNMERKKEKGVLSEIESTPKKYHTQDTKTKAGQLISKLVGAKEQGGRKKQRESRKTYKGKTSKADDRTQAYRTKTRKRKNILGKTIIYGDTLNQQDKRSTEDQAGSIPNTFRERTKSYDIVDKDGNKKRVYFKTQEEADRYFANIDKDTGRVREQGEMEEFEKTLPYTVKDSEGKEKKEEFKSTVEAPGSVEAWDDEKEAEIRSSAQDAPGTGITAEHSALDFSGQTTSNLKNPSKYSDKKTKYVYDPAKGTVVEKVKRRSGIGYKKTGREKEIEGYQELADEKRKQRESEESKKPSRKEKRQQNKADKQRAKEEKAKQAEVARKAREEGKSSYEYKGTTYNITPKVMKGGGTLMDQYNRKYNTGGVNMDEDQDGLPIGVDATPGGTMQGPTMPPNNNQMSVSGNNLGEIKDPLANDEPEPDNLFEEDVNIENTDTGDNNINLQDEGTNQGDMGGDNLNQGDMDQGQETAAPTRAQLRHERKMSRQKARADRRMVRTQARQQRKADRLAARQERRSRRQDRKDQRQEARISKREDRRFERQQKRNMRRRNRRGNFKHGGMVKGKKGAGLGIIIVVGRKSNKKGK
jgi:hypothetical protein